MKTNSLSRKNSCDKGNLILRNLQTIIINKAARVCGFLIRKGGKISPKNLIIGFMIMASKHRNTYSCWAYEIGILSNKTITKQAVEERMNPKTEKFLLRVLEDHLKTKLTVKISIKTKGLLKHFKNVKIDDSTVLALPTILVKQFPGNVSKGIRKAQAKIHTMYNLTNNSYEFFHLHSYSENDQSLSAKVLPYLQKGDLLIRDLGFTILSVVEKVMKMEVYFISRKNHNIKVFDINNGKEINLVKELSKNGFIDQEVLAGSERKLKVRLIAIPLSEAQANERRRKARADRDKRLNHSPEYDYLLGFIIFITNIEFVKCNAEQIAQLYRLRWRIEIIFKSWKSCFSMESLIHFQCTNAIRVKCIIYLILLYIYLFHVVWYICVIKKTKNTDEQAPLSILKMAQFFNDQFTKLISLKSDRLITQQIVKNGSYDKRKDRINAVEFIYNLAA
jgi:hypothetical protein